MEYRIASIRSFKIKQNHCGAMIHLAYQVQMHRDKDGGRSALRQA